MVGLRAARLRRAVDATECGTLDGGCSGALLAVCDTVASGDLVEVLAMLRERVTDDVAQVCDDAKTSPIRAEVLDYEGEVLHPEQYPVGAAAMVTALNAAHAGSPVAVRSGIREMLNLTEVERGRDVSWIFEAAAVRARDAVARNGRLS